MNRSAKLTMLKCLVGETGNSNDAALTVYLDLAAAKILNRLYPFDPTQDTVPLRYETLQCEVAAYLWNKRGAEGQTAHSENGITRQYENADVPSSMLKTITPYCGVPRR